MALGRYKNKLGLEEKSHDKELLFELVCDTAHIHIIQPCSASNSSETWVWHISKSFRIRSSPSNSYDCGGLLVIINFYYHKIILKHF